MRRRHQHTLKARKARCSLSGGQDSTGPAGTTVRPCVSTGKEVCAQKVEKVELTAARRSASADARLKNVSFRTLVTFLEARRKKNPNERTICLVVAVALYAGLMKLFVSREKGEEEEERYLLDGRQICQVVEWMEAS